MALYVANKACPARIGLEGVADEGEDAPWAHRELSAYNGTEPRGLGRIDGGMDAVEERVGRANTEAAMHGGRRGPMLS